ncbi:hypothetical protein BDW02DRAFT_465412, partial [Decorospora gaudefroyi]
LPPDVAAVRKARMNADLIRMFKRPCPPETDPTIKGIGLYTHVEGPPKIPLYPHQKYLDPEPEFLPLEKPLGSEGTSSQMSEDVRKLWEEVRDIIQAEEEAIGTTELGLKELKKRYGGFDAPETASVPAQQVVLQQQDAAMQEEIAVHDGTTNSPVNGRRPGVNGSSATGNGDMAMTGTE